MNTINSTLTILAALALPCAALATSPLPIPNIVIIVADDLGFGGVSYNGSFIRTPNIDRLAAEGVQLTHFYVSPMCSPTRAGLMTGRYPMRYGMGRSVVRPWAVYGLPPEELTLPEALAAAGYRHRGIFGKWHLGHLKPEWHPLSQGFTEFLGQYNGASDYFTRIRDGEPDWHRDATPIEEKGYTTDLIADHACAFIDKHAKDGPFFCYVPFTAPHDPLQAPESYLKQYANAGATAGPPAVTRDRRALAAMVTCMDEGIGRILRALRDRGVAHRTLVWFFSDNGGLTRLRLNGDLREGKLTVYEGGIRVPSAVWWPGAIDGGRKVDAPLVNVDIMPTLLRLVCGTGVSPVSPCGTGILPVSPCGPGVSPVSSRPFDGRDVSDLLTGRSNVPPQRDIYAFNGQSGLDKEQLAIISADGWKLVIIGPDVSRPEGYHTPQHCVELFRLSDDPNERQDLASAHPDIVKDLAARLVAFRKSEPPNALATMNQPPAGFRPPPKWRNHPVTQPG